MDAPEKIWATGNAHYGSWNSVEVRNADHQVEYTRTDRANELVAAAYEAAAEVCPKTIKTYEMLKPGKPDQFASREAQIVAKGFARLIQEEIRSLTPADAVAAQAARDARIREAALREAYVNLKTYRPHEVDGPEHDVGYTAGYVTAMSRVEALIAKDKANG